jgi:hypothetical protein
VALGGARNDILELRVTLDKAEHRREAYGWTKALHLQVKLARESEHLGREDLGQTLHYFIGAGSKPGIVASKAVSKRMLRLQDSSEADAFRPVDDLAILAPLLS